MKLLTTFISYVHSKPKIVKSSLGWYISFHFTKLATLVKVRTGGQGKIPVPGAAILFRSGIERFPGNLFIISTVILPSAITLFSSDSSQSFFVIMFAP